MVVHALVVDLRRGLTGVPAPSDPVEGEGAQSAPGVAPGVQIPVVPVVDKALGRHRAAGGGIALASVIDEGEPPPPHEGAGDGGKGIGRGGARGHGEDPYTAHEVALAQAFVGENVLDAFAKRRDEAVQQPRLDAGQQPLGGEQCVELGGVETRVPGSS